MTTPAPMPTINYVTLNGTTFALVRVELNALNGNLPVELNTVNGNLEIAPISGFKQADNNNNKPTPKTTIVTRTNAAKAEAKTKVVAKKAPFKAASTTKAKTPINKAKTVKVEPPKPTLDTTKKLPPLMRAKLFNKFKSATEAEAKETKEAHVKANVESESNKDKMDIDTETTKPDEPTKEIKEIQEINKEIKPADDANGLSMLASVAMDVPAVPVVAPIKVPVVFSEQTTEKIEKIKKAIKTMESIVARIDTVSTAPVTVPPAPVPVASTAAIPDLSLEQIKVEPKSPVPFVPRVADIFSGAIDNNNYNNTMISTPMISTGSKIRRAVRVVGVKQEHIVHTQNGSTPINPMVAVKTESKTKVDVKSEAKVAKPAVKTETKVSKVKSEAKTPVKVEPRPPICFTDDLESIYSLDSPRGLDRLCAPMSDISDESDDSDFEYGSAESYYESDNEDDDDDSDFSGASYSSYSYEYGSESGSDSDTLTDIDIPATTQKANQKTAKIEPKTAQKFVAKTENPPSKTRTKQTQAWDESFNIPGKNKDAFTAVWKCPLSMSSITACASMIPMTIRPMINGLTCGPRAQKAAAESLASKCEEFADQCTTNVFGYKLRQLMRVCGKDFAMLPIGNARKTKKWARGIKREMRDSDTESEDKPGRPHDSDECDEGCYVCGQSTHKACHEFRALGYDFPVASHCGIRLHLYYAFTNFAFRLWDDLAAQTTPQGHQQVIGVYSGKFVRMCDILDHLSSILHKTTDIRDIDAIHRDLVFDDEVSEIYE